MWGKKKKNKTKKKKTPHSSQPKVAFNEELLCQQQSATKIKTLI